MTETINLDNTVLGETYRDNILREAALALGYDSMTAWRDFIAMSTDMEEGGCLSCQLAYIQAMQVMLANYAQELLDQIHPRGSHSMDDVNW